MSTKYILSGGYANEVNSINDSFFREIIKGTSDSVNILVIMFAKTGNDIRRFYDITKDQFERNRKDKKITYRLASTESLASDIAESQIIYIHGGETIKLIEDMEEFSEFLQLIKGKIVAGESAGAYLLASKFICESIGFVHDGTGALPINLMCHFNGKNEEKLDSIDNNLEKVLLRDYEYRVYVQ